MELKCHVIKILKYGTLVNGVTYRAVCNNCGSIFTFNKIDADFVSSINENEQSSSCWNVTCPVCGNVISKEKLSYFDVIMN